MPFHSKTTLKDSSIEERYQAVVEEILVCSIKDIFFVKSKRLTTRGHKDKINIKRRSLNWIFSSKRNTFDYYCEMLGIDSDSIRERIKKSISKDIK